MKTRKTLGVMTLALGLAFAFGTTAIAQEANSQRTRKHAKSGKIICVDGAQKTVRAHKAGFKRGAHRLQLTEIQRTQAREMMRQSRQEALAVLTPEQRAKMSEQMKQFRQRKGQTMGQRQPGAMKQYRGMAKQGIRSLNLTADQQAQLKTIRGKRMAEFRAILTPEQQAQIDTFRQGRQRPQAAPQP